MNSQQPAVVKTCSICKNQKSAECFGADKRATDGLQPCCRECANARRRQRYEEDPERYKLRQRKYSAENPAIIKAISARSRIKNADTIKARKKSAYERNKHKPEFLLKRDAHTAKVKEQKREYDKRYRVENADRLDKIKAAWRAANAGLIRAVKASYKARRRAQESKGDGSRVIAAWVESAPKVCYWCGNKCHEAFHVDHYKPLSKGGKHEVSNLVIACPTCNLRKNAKDPLEFAASMGRLF